MWLGKELSFKSFPDPGLQFIHDMVQRLRESFRKAAEGPVLSTVLGSGDMAANNSGDCPQGTSTLARDTDKEKSWSLPISVSVMKRITRYKGAERRRQTWLGTQRKVPG